MSEVPKVVAVFNSSADTVALLEAVLQEAGYATVSGHVGDVQRGLLDFIAFIEQHDPRVVVWDISLPYENNWRFFQLLRSSDALKERGIVLTTTHKAHLDRMVGEETGALEIVGKPYDLEAIVKAVGNAARTATGR